ncbi:MAG: sigma 54-interacting transcriptional regulator [Desulfobacula sp.]|jgi:PAS domain S-box-containing protein|nr:sigma 54-interacting transcriptional regulator [Desulfobacula sp.]
MNLIKKNLSELWPTILDSSNNGILLIDDQGVIIFYNEAASLIFGHPSAQDVIGKNIAEIRPEAWPDLKNIIKTGQPQFKKKITLSNVTIIANRCPVEKDGKVIGVLSIFQDISEYETVISELQGYQRLHKELKAIFESSYDGLYITDGNANTIRFNRAYQRITGLSKKDLIGRNMHTLVEEKVIDHSVTLEVLEKKKPITILQQIKGDKQLIVTGTPVFDENNEIFLVVTNVRDITKLNNLRGQLEDTKRINSRFYQTLQEYDGIEHALKEMVIKSQTMIQVIKKAIKVARAETSVLLLGESGVGKSMLAGIIHKMSPRKDDPFIKINCGVIPDSLMESELFGYEKGAFTGALPTGKAGLIEIAHGGTVFLDEIGELKLDMQVKLLEVIEDKTFTKVGSQHSVNVNANIIAATSRDLKKMISEGTFREDLYYRLNVVPISIPSLRQRKEDILPLTINILKKFNKQKKLNKRLAPETLDMLARYNFPGNVRELINIVERMIIMSEEDLIGIADLPSEIREKDGSISNLSSHQGSLKKIIARIEYQVIKETVSRCESISEASRELDLHPTTLWRKMTKHGIKY